MYVLTIDCPLALEAIRNVTDIKSPNSHRFIYYLCGLGEGGRGPKPGLGPLGGRG